MVSSSGGGKFGMKIKIFMAVKRLKGWHGITTSLEVGTHNENVRTFCNFTFSMAKGGPIDVMAVREHRPDIDVTNHNRIYYELWKNYVEESNSAKRRTGEPAKAFNLKLHFPLCNSQSPQVLSFLSPRVWALNHRSHFDSFHQLEFTIRSLLINFIRKKVEKEEVHNSFGRQN